MNGSPFISLTDPIFKKHEGKFPTSLLQSKVLNASSRPHRVRPRVQVAASGNVLRHQN